MSNFTFNNHGSTIDNMDAGKIKIGSSNLETERNCLNETEIDV